MINPNYSIFRYIQSIAMPFAYTEPFVPDIAVGMDRYVKFGTVVPRTYTLNANDVLEVLLISPNYYIQLNTYCKQAVLLSKVNPTSTTSLDSRYTLANDVFQEFETPDSPSYLHKASGCVSATGLTKFEGIYYQKAVSDIALPMTSVQLTNTSLMQFNVPANHQTWINSFPCPTEKRNMTTDAYKPGQCGHYMGRFTNISGNNIQITVTGVWLLEKTDPTYTIVPKVMKQTPLGLCGYMFEPLRSAYTFVLHDPLDAIGIKNKKIELKKAIKNALSSVVSQWQNMSGSTTGFNAKVLINFIIFYLE